MNKDWLVQSDTGNRQNHDASGDELLALGAIVDGGLGAYREFAFNLRVRVYNKFQFVGIPIAIQ